MLKTLGVIPARFGSTRFPGKPLALINGISLIERVYTAAAKNNNLSQLIVATDHDDIYKHVQEFGGNVVMTADDIQTGSDRVWQAVKDQDVDIVVNIQGDEPLLDISWLDKLISAFSEQDVQMSTLAKLMKVEDLENKDIVKVILDHNNNAIYFSRFAIPYSRKTIEEVGNEVYKHIGLYAYRKDFLKEYCNHSQATLEKAESLEQLRALYMGAKIKVLEVFEDAIGVDRPGDIKKIENILNDKILS